jgi:membrane fusion protein, multidrug efflux system
MDEQVSRMETLPLEHHREVGEVGQVVRARRRIRWGWIIPLIALAGLALWLHPWSRSSHPSNRGAEPPQAIRDATATVGDMPIVMNGLGTVVPLATVTVRTQINGQLMELGFHEGELVKKGDFLAQIDPRPFQAALDQFEGQLKHDQGLLKQAEMDYTRFQTLNRQDSIARQQVEDQYWLIKQDEGLVASDQAQIETQKLNLVYCHITAPVTGRVGLRQVDAGNYVQTTDTNGLVVLTQLQPISVIFMLPEDNVPAVMKQLATGAKLSVTAYDRSNTTKIGTGTLETVDNQVDTTTGTVKLRAIFPNQDNSLFPNQFVNAQLLVSTDHNVLLVPNPAIQTGAPGTYLYVVNPDNTVSVRVVKTGPTDGHHTVIASGLEAGDKVVIDGADRLREGAKVTVVGSHAQDNAAGQAGTQPAPNPAPDGQHHHHQEQQSQ